MRLPLAGEEALVRLPVLAGHEHIDYGVDAGSQVDQDVPNYGQKVLAGITQDLKISKRVLDQHNTMKKEMYNCCECIIKGLIKLF